ncbi:MAG: tryptophanase [Nitrospirae bacterium]|nr:MAG: tryptophanase [Nitrospirota bacterium]
MSWPFRTIIEPFKIKVVEPIRFTTREERQVILREARYNMFNIRAQDVLIDLLTDSGTAAMSSEQWAVMMRGDNAYAGSTSFYRFEAVVKELTGYQHIIPTHQGRAAEKILFSLVGGQGKCIPSNTHFDTTRANVEFTGAEAVDLVIPEGKQSQAAHPFKGNMDLHKLERLLAAAKPGQVPLCMVTVTNNSGGGQPVSMHNLRETRKLCQQYGVPLFLDACRFAENAFFIKRREPGYQEKATIDIAKEMFRLSDGCTMSAKKDGLVNIGGFLGMNDSGLAQQARNLLILTEGFPTYGGLAGRDLEAIAQGLHEVLDEDYLTYRLRSVEYLAERLRQIGYPLIEPPGGHAVYIDARMLLPHIPATQFPGQSLCSAFFEYGGIRTVEVGNAMFGRTENGKEIPADMDLVRLAIPRRAYTQSHIDYVVEVAEEIYKNRHALRGFRVVKQAPILRHFTIELEPCD